MGTASWKSACVELVDHFPTGRTLQFYLNPERDVPIESQRVHGLSNEFLADKPLLRPCGGGISGISWATRRW